MDFSSLAVDGMSVARSLHQKRGTGDELRK